MSFDLNQEITPEQISRLNELERREWDKLTKDKWYLDLKPTIKKAVNHFPPFYVYKLKDTGHLGFIHSYDDKKDDEQYPITVTMRLTPQYNKDLVVERLIGFVPLEALERVMLRRVADTEKIISSGIRDIVMPALANREQALRKSQNTRNEKRKEQLGWQVKKLLDS